jgi:hypothetical protein
MSRDRFQQRAAGHPVAAHRKYSNFHVSLSGPLESHGATATITTARLRMTSRALLGASSISRRSRSSKWEV